MNKSYMYPYYIHSVNLYKAFEGKQKKQAAEGYMQYATYVKGFWVQYVSLVYLHTVNVTLLGAQLCEFW